MVIGDKAVLEQSFSFNGDVCLSFFYYVDKEDFGSLRIHFDTELIWILPGNQTVDWLYGSVTIHGDSASKKVRRYLSPTDLVRLANTLYDMYEVETTNCDLYILHGEEEHIDFHI